MYKMGLGLGVMFIGLRLHLQNGLRVRGYVYRVTVTFTKWA